MVIVDWPQGVNRIVTSEANISLGEQGIISDNSENGTEMSRLSGSGTPDRYNVTMYFSNSKYDSFYKNHVDIYGRNVSEWQAFRNWFKYTLLNGVNSFRFSSLDDLEGGKGAVYKISSSGLPKGNPVGEYIKVTMLWIEQFTTYITVNEYSVMADSIEVGDGFIELYLTESLSDNPKVSDFLLSNGNSAVTYSTDGVKFQPLFIQGLDYDGGKTLILYFDASLMANSQYDYTVRVLFGQKTVESNYRA